MDVLDLLDALPRRLIAGQVLEHGVRRLFVARVDEVARRLRHEHHAREQHDRRHSGEPEHQAPVLGRREDRVDDVREQNAPDDHQLVERRDPPSLFGRRDLREVERHDHGGGADGEAEDEPRGDEDADGRRERGEQRADGEHGGRDHDQQPTAEPIG